MTAKPKRPLRRRQAAPRGLAVKSISIGGRRTSVRLDPVLWNGLADIARRERLDINQICTYVARTKQARLSFSAALRMFLFSYFRSAATEHGHVMAGHGEMAATLAILQSRQTSRSHRQA